MKAGKIERARGLLYCVAVTTLFVSTSRAQFDSTQEPSLGDLGREVRKERASPDHVGARKVLDEETADGSRTQPAGTYSCYIVPCVDLNYRVPAGTKSGRPGNFLRIPLDKNFILVTNGRAHYSPGSEDDQDSFDLAEETLMSDLADSWYLGGCGIIKLEEITSFSGQPARLVRFTASVRGIDHLGVAVFVRVPEQIMNMACIYRKVDFDKAEGICQQIIDTIEMKIPSQYKLNPPKDP